MHLDLIDALRCPARHDESTLVASIDRLDGRYIAEGSLGCPVCRARYPIGGFVAWFTPAETAAKATDPAPRIGDDALLRAAALLDMRAPGARYLLTGTWGWLAAALAAAYDVQLVVLNPPPGVEPGDGLSILRVGDRLPMAAGTAAGVAIDASVAGQQELLGGLLAAVRPAGRLVGPVTLERPRGTTELARDDRHWVAERSAPELTIPLRRANR
jgi:uncharacterized protein YbaR (Trm112 family)